MTAEPRPSLDGLLIESEARYRAVIENAWDMIQSVRPDGTFEFVNRAWCDKLGYTQDDIHNINIWDIIHPDSVEHCQLLFQHAAMGNDVEHFDAIFITRDGVALPVEGNAASRIVDGKIIATHSFVRDISERVRAVELERLNAKLERDNFTRNLEKMAALGKLSAGLAHELNNPAAAAQRAGSRLAEIMDRRDAATRRLTTSNISAEQWHAMDAFLGAANNASQSEESQGALQISALEEDLERWLEQHEVDEPWSLAPTLAHAAISVGDLDQLASGLSHDVLSDAITCAADTFEMRELAQIVARSSHRISELVNSVKAYSFMDRALEQHVDVHAGLDNTLIMLAHRLKNVTVAKEYDRGIPQIRALGSGLNQVWTNIIDNAVDASNETGTVTIRTRGQGEHVVVEIEDDGCGIPEDNLNRIFEPFFTTKQQGQGTGLGLDIVWRIITEEHGGTLDVESRPGRTVFKATLPVEKPASVPDSIPV